MALSWPLLVLVFFTTDVTFSTGKHTPAVIEEVCRTVTNAKNKRHTVKDSFMQRDVTAGSTVGHNLKLCVVK